MTQLWEIMGLNPGGGPIRRRRFGAGQLSAVLFRRRILFFEASSKINEAGNFLNSVEREPVETRVLNPSASEAS